ncbi:MAG: PAS domain S-box protein [Desulfobulbus sp.]|nr:MAG: PAS domain S-box protein [Desulfobulbus sp.]
MRADTMPMNGTNREHNSNEDRAPSCREEEAFGYIRDKVNQMLTVIGTFPLKPDELDDDTLIQLDPLGIISDTFRQILTHLNETNIDLEAARDDLRAIFDSVGEGIMVLNTQGEIITYNEKMKSLFIDDSLDAVGLTCRDAVCNGETSEANCLFFQIRKRRKSVRVRSWHCRNRFYEIVATPIFSRDGELQRIVILYMNITNRRRTEMALLESEDRYRDLFDNATDMLLIIAPDGRILVVNKAWQETLGYDDDAVAHLNIFDILHPDHCEACRDKLRKILEDGREIACQAVFRSKAGKEVFVEGKINCRFVDGRPVALRGFFRDITEKLHMEEEMRRTQKLEAVGLLAGGIAHDFNNLLTGIIGNILLAKLKSNDPEVNQLLQNTENASYRAQELTRQLLTFAKGGAPVKETASVLGIIKEVTAFVLSGSKTTWTLEAEEEIKPVDVDTGQFSQVLQNLVINSDQAMPDGGMITVRVSNCTLSKQNAHPLPAGEYVRIDIRDQGIGVAKEHLSRIFDPYFSTKKRGSGLGLATAYSIIRNHNGLLTVDSELGVGTTMTIFLPVSTRKIKEKEAVSAEPRHGMGKILVMDDDEIVRKVVLQMLTHLGYEVAEAENGERAVEMYQEAIAENRPYDGVILDLTVPGKMGGKETIARLRSLDPQVKAIVSSGYSNDPIMADYTKYGFSGVVPKPYSMEKLSETVHSLFVK